MVQDFKKSKETNDFLFNNSSVSFDNNNIY